MVERAVWDREAAGSKPVTRTINPLKSLISEDFCYFFVYCGAENVGALLRFVFEPLIADLKSHLI